MLINEGGTWIPLGTEKDKPIAWPGSWYGSWPIITTFTSDKGVSLKALNNKLLHYEKVFYLLGHRFGSLSEPQCPKWVEKWD